MRLLLLLAILAAPGCAGSKVYHDGRVVFQTQANVTNLTIRERGFYFHADKLNHSQATDAGGRATGKIFQGGAGLATAIGAAVATKGAITP